MWQTIKFRSARVRRYLKGRKTIWAARAYVVAGLLVMVKDVADANGFHLSEYLPASLTTSASWPFVLIGTGVLFEGLRRITYTAPLVATNQGTPPNG